MFFQDIIFTLQKYWADKGCAILQPYDLEMGAGTYHPATVIKALKEDFWKVAYVQPSRRPVDSRYGKHPNRLQHYYQFQVILKPAPENIQQLYLGSIEALGIDVTKNDIRFVEDDWESPTIGACGLGWEVWCNGMEVSQFTYMQQIGGLECNPPAGEITYGLERIALYIQNCSDYKDIIWNDHYTYGALFQEQENQFSQYNLEYSDVDLLRRHFDDAEASCQKLLHIPLVAYENCIKAGHIFNLLEARGVISVTERASYIARVRALAKMVVQNI